MYIICRTIVDTVLYNITNKSAEDVATLIILVS